MSEVAKPVELINQIVADMKVFSAQCGDIEDMNKEVEKAKHNLEATQHNLKIYRLELAETEGGYKKLQREVEGKFAERDRLTAEIRELTVKRDQIAAELQRFRQQFGA